jgi:hypothetical protein
MIAFGLIYGAAILLYTCIARGHGMPDPSSAEPTEFYQPAPQDN